MSADGGPASRVYGAWEQDRPYLVNLAFRMLGDIGEAEDVVQDAFERLLAQDIAGIIDVRGWLTVVTGRLCLDQIRLARRRLQRPRDLDAIEASLPGIGASFIDPADRVTLDDSVRLALSVVLDRLTPAERVAFVLHDIFQVPFDAVAETVGRTPQACRQLARRARTKIGTAVADGDAAPTGAEQRLVTDRFIAACATGDLAGLLAVLDPAVTGWVDLLPDRITEGADLVAANILRFWAGRARLVALSTGRRPVLLGFIGTELRAVILLYVDAELITEIHVTANPGAIARLPG
jgi:RNA polymerase sigma-70 factor (ECF subfamily)